MWTSLQGFLFGISFSVLVGSCIWWIFWIIPAWKKAKLAAKSQQKIQETRNQYEIDAEKSRVLACQWLKKNDEHPNGAINCDACKDRFLCYGMTARKFAFTESYAEYKTHEVYAEDEGEARSLFSEYYCDGYIVEEVDADRNGQELDMEEVPIREKA